MNDLQNPKQKGNLRFLFILFILCFTIHLALSLIGWKNPLTDRHAFRQTQTAISTYYTVKEGFKINYITPVMGKPWSIPLEFPLYQWMVAAVVLVSKMPLDQTGRFVNLLLFYLSLVPIYFLLKRFISDKAQILVFLCIILASPLYIFWSRTFLIEPSALFLSLVFLAGVVTYVTSPKKYVLAISCVAGTLAGLTKITTFAVFVIPAVCFFIILNINNIKLAGIKIFIKRNFSAAVFLFFVPFIVNVWWANFAENQRSYNIMANEELNDHQLMYQWVFGTISQRLLVITWREVLHYIAYPILGGKYLILIPAVLFIMARKYRLHATVCFLCFLLGPLIFSNLYFHHEYYYYANSIFLLCSLGFLMISVLERYKQLTFVRFLLLPALLGLMYLGFFNQYYDIQKNDNSNFRPLTETIKSVTEENDVIVIIGFDWVPVIPYYSQRKALMDYCGMHGEPEKFDRVLKSLEDENIGGMVLGRWAREEPAFALELARRFNLAPSPMFHDDFADFYVPKKP